MARGRVFLILGVVFALIAGLSVYLIANQAKPQQVAVQDVMVAAVDIQPRTFITADNAKMLFTVTKWPVAMIPPNSLMQPSDAVSKVIVDRVAKGLPVVATNLSSSKTTGQTGLSIDIPSDMVAESMSIADPDAVAGAIAPGDYVDILLSAPHDATQVQATPTAGPVATPAPKVRAEDNGGPSQDASSVTSITQTVLQHVKVIAVGQKTAAAPPAGQQGAQPAAASATTITLLLSHQDALLIKFVKDGGGAYDLVLRRYDDAKADNVTIPVTRSYVEEKYNFLGKITPTPTPTSATTPGATPSPTAKAS